MEEPNKRFYEFGPFCLDIKERLLLRDAEPVSLTPKAFDTLCLLVQNSGRVLEKDELMKRIWPDSFVEEATLAQNIFTLRKILGPKPDEHQYIETVPRRGYRFVASVNGWSSKSAEQAPAETASSPETRSIAVLPFQVLTPESNHEYFGVGMADALITRLSNIEKIVVRPTSAVVKYRGMAHDLVAAGKELKVELVLEGRIQQCENRVRVTVQLVNASTAAPLWADKFDESFVDIFTVQDRISAQVAEALTLKLTGDEKKRLTKRQTHNTEAYEYYLKGRHQWSKCSERGFQKSVKNFRNAIEKDPTFALAHAGLAGVYSALASYGQTPPNEVMPQAKAAARKALELDESLAEAHFPMAAVHMFYDWDWAAAEAEFKRAIRLNPGYAMAHQGYGLLLLAMGRFDESRAMLQKALEIDPVSPLINTTMGFPDYFEGKYDQAKRHYQKALDEDASFGLAHLSLAEVYTQKGMYDKAVEIYRRAMSLSGRKLSALPSLGYAFALSGNRDAAIEILHEMEQIESYRYVTPVAFAILCVGLGEKDAAFEWLEKAYQERSSKLVFANVQPIFNPLRSDPRFDDLIKRLGLASLALEFAL